jgi:hypothetical protein
MLDAPVPYVWLAPASSQGDPAETRVLRPGRAPDVEHARIREWAHARGAVLVRPLSLAATAPRPDPATADAIEVELGTARDALAALDVASLESALARAEQLLRDHPELPQAAWLRAEVERGWASRFTRAEPRDEARAARAWKRAAALDGGRVPGVGETALGSPDLVPVTFRFEAQPDIVVTIDGRVVKAGDQKLAEGEHQVLVRKRGRDIWASWVGVAKGAAVSLPDFSDAPCSEGDFADVRLGATGLDPGATRCSHWFVVRGGEAIAQCRGNACGAFMPFADPRLTKNGDANAANGRDAAARAPSWLPWAALGLGVVVTGTSLLLASGIFDKPARDTRFVAGGLKSE